MATPPLPDVSCVRVRLVYNTGGSDEAGSRFYLSYSGSAPTGANCATLATDIAADWSSHCAGLVHSSTTLVEVDVLDITTPTGASGQWTGSIAGTLTGQALAIQLAQNVEYGVAIRYRGGKPRMYLPPPDVTAVGTSRTWTSGWTTGLGTAVAAFFAAVTSHSVGSMGTLAHVLLSYYEGYTSRTTGGGQVTFKPKYRSPNALHYNVLSYIPKSLMSSQKRRRTSTTP